jgi:DNA-binding GntR family transcriptional regulator
VSRTPDSDLLPTVPLVLAGGDAVPIPITGSRLRHAAYNHIRDLIVSNQLPPGRLLTIDDLVRQLGVGRTPVREALLRLQSEHLVEILPQRAIRVAEITPIEVRELFAVRELLEGAAVEHASQVIPAALLDALDAQIATAGHQLAAGQHELYARSDLDLHTQIRLHAGNSMLTTLLELIHDRAHRIRLFAGFYSAHPAAAEVIAEHHGIVDALRRREATTARHRLAEHLRKSTNRILDQLATAPATAGPVPARRRARHAQSESMPGTGE